VTNLDKLETLIPLEDLEESAVDQIHTALAQPFLKKLVIMPDCHTGYDLPIGAIALLDGVISPSYVGYDIGCGMCSVVTDLKAADLDHRARTDLFDRIYKAIPCGVGGYHEGRKDETFTSASGSNKLDDRVSSRLNSQMGTLGGGNHFIELGENKEGFLSITIHSGSRNPGWVTAQYWMDFAKADPEFDGGFLRLDSSNGRAYVEDMNYFLLYALENRLRMMAVTIGVVEGKAQAGSSAIINENHNHAAVQGSDVLHRKGATPAEQGVLGVIPGTMRDGVYITKGLGNEQYLSSASHGAGRRMSRTQAKQEIKIEDHRAAVKGIVCRTDRKVLDESPDAYKNVHEVVKAQEGIVVEVLDHAKPIVNVKG